MREEKERCGNIAGQDPKVISENAYVVILIAQQQNNWCAKYECTTCGTMDLRRAIEEIKPYLFNAMMDLNVEELSSFSYYKEVTRIAVDYLILDERMKTNDHWPTVSLNLGRM